MTQRLDGIVTREREREIGIRFEQIMKISRGLTRAHAGNAEADDMRLTLDTIRLHVDAIERAIADLEQSRGH